MGTILRWWPIQLHPLSHSPDVSLSYDRIKLRLEEYRTLLASDSDKIELSTENGKTVICRKQANEMEEYLDQAETLLRDVIQSRDISTLVVLRHLCYLAAVLDNLKLYDECGLAGNCALDLAEALVRRSLEFRQAQAEALALIAGLSVYQPRARTLFTQAVSICEEVVENNPSQSNKYRFLLVLDRAGDCASAHLGAQWVGRAVQLMTEELPPTIVQPDFRAGTYNNYGFLLRQLEQHSNAIEAYHESVSIRRTLIVNHPTKHNFSLAETLMNMGMALWSSGKYDGAIVAYKEALEICTTMSEQDPLRYNKLMAITLLNYGLALFVTLKQVSEAAAVQKQAISLLRDLARAGSECTKLLGDALYSYGFSCRLLEQHAEAVPAYQESILLRRTLAATDPEEERHLILALHDILPSFIALGRCAEANTAATEALERNHGRVFKTCPCALNFQVCNQYQSAVIAHPPGPDSPPLLFSPANSSPRPTEHSGAGAFHTPANIPPSATSTHITSKPTVKIPVHRKRDKILGLFRGNRGP